MMEKEKAYNKALEFAQNHYENFPVVSFLVPKNLRKHIAIIYWFARTADDFADEGNFSAEVRLQKLNNFEERLTNLLNNDFQNEFEFALSETIKEKKLSPEYFYNLLKAFKQDVIKKRYNDFEELIDYCGNSANPVGRLILNFTEFEIEEAFDFSDKICTALQLTNFYQDVSIDFQKGRIYLPQDEIRKFDVDENQFEIKEINLNLRQLIKFNVERAEKLFEEGKPLLKFLKGRLKYEIGWTILGGEAILKKIRKNNFDVLQRPKLSKKDFLILLLKSFKMK